MADTADLPDAPRGRETSAALTEIRTVLSRAQDARRVIVDALVYDCPNADEPNFSPYRCPDYPHVTTREPADFVAAREEHERMHAHPDPDRDEMLAAIDAFVDSALHWRRTGRPIRKR